MENKLAENIRRYRKEMGLTQEQLSERLGITLGAVSKWERGGSEPDLGYIMELAELFHVSVDALIGFSMHGTDADEEALRIEELVHRVTPEEMVSEFEGALKRFPNHFRLVLGAAEANRRIGVMEKKDANSKRALVLYRHALELISQNRDPEINEIYLRNEIAGCYSDLKDYRKAVEEYKRNNPTGNNDAKIGLLMIHYEKKPEEGIEYTERALCNMIGELTSIMGGTIYYYVSTGRLAQGLHAAEWSVAMLKNLKEDQTGRSFLDKIICIVYLVLAVILDAYGQAEKAEETLRTSFRIARAFDAAPLYSLENVIFTEHMPKNIYVYDSTGPTAVEGLKGTLEEFSDFVSGAFRKKFDREYSRIG